MEILLSRSFSIKEEVLLDMHSVLNVLNVIIYELMQLAIECEPCDEVDALTDSTVDIARRLSDKDEAYRIVAEVDAYTQQVRGTLAKVAAERGLQDAGTFKERVANLESIFAILSVRAHEITARNDNPDAWVHHPVDNLKQNFFEVFRAIERNSHGGYRIVTNVAEHEEGDYLVNFEISSVLGKVVLMPAVFQDVMRDLLANARKYTQPGGTITSGLFCSTEELRFVVSDTGRGIPSDEILQVVEFGRRGSNVQDRPSRGAGFGLTKAYYVTRKFGGRMFIDSDGMPGGGTRIEIRLPCPQ